jgi:putative cell wall-binding protein
MRRILSSALLTVTAVPALLAVPVVGTRAAAPVPVHTQLHVLTPSGVDAAALAQLRAAGSGAGSPAASGRVTAAAVASPAVLTGQLATPRYDLVAVSWQRSAEPKGATRVTVRVREAGKWTGWTPLDTDDDGPDPGSADAQHAAAVGAADATAPLLTAGADGVQVRVDTATGVPPAGLKVDLVDGGRSSADGAAGSGGPMQTASAQTSMPRIVSRAAWGADESLAKASPVLGSVRSLVLHHTDTTNSYSSDQAYAQLRSLYTFHTKVRGWNDVGYNFVVDRFGTVYEGRRGSITSAVMGAHAGGFNEQTLGIATLGTFSTDALPAATQDALVPLLAWKAAEYGINPAGRTSLVSAGGSYTKYKAGTSVGVYGVSGHRDVDSTECPGNLAYPRLAGLRSRAAALMVPDLVAPALSAQRATVAGVPFSFTAAVPTRQRYAITVSRLCGGSAVRTLTGTTTGRISRSWDLRDSDGALVPPGVYSVTVASSSPVGSVPTWHQDVEVLATPGSVAASGSTGSTGSASVPLAGGATASASASASGSVGSASVPTDVGPARLPLRVVSPTSAPTTSTTSSTATTTATATTTTVRTTLTTFSTTSTTSSTSTSPSSTPPAGGGLPAAASNGCPVRRLATADPALTSVIAGRLAHPDSRAVVLVDPAAGEPLGQSLTAGTLAAAQAAPLLLTDAGALPAVVAQDVAARQVTTAWLVGSTSVISPAVEQQLRALGVSTVTRIAGTDRWSTAAAVAQAATQAIVQHGGTASREAVLASGDSGELLDSLVAAGAAAAVGRPMLLTSRTGIPAATLAAIKALGITSVDVISSTAAVPEPTLAALTAAGVTRHVRLVGKGRWATAATIADAFVGQAATDRVVLASGLQADADLVIATGQGRRILLTSSTVLPWETAAWLRKNPNLGVGLVAGPDGVGTVVLRAVQATRAG